MAKTQAQMWETEDAPLFSGAAPRAEVEAFEPAEVERQESLARCRVCLDTGWVLVDGRRRRCWCGAGEQGEV